MLEFAAVDPSFYAFHLAKAIGWLSHKHAIIQWPTERFNSERPLPGQL